MSGGDSYGRWQYILGRLTQCCFNIVVVLVVAAIAFMAHRRYTARVHITPTNHINTREISPAGFSFAMLYLRRKRHITESSYTRNCYLRHRCRAGEVLTAVCPSVRPFANRTTQKSYGRFFVYEICRMGRLLITEELTKFWKVRVRVSAPAAFRQRRVAWCRYMRSTE